MGGGKSGITKKSVKYGEEEWRQAQPRYQKKTAGGVPFWDSPNGWTGEHIPEKMYNRLNADMKKAIVYLEQSKTADGVHATAYYVNSSGELQYYDDYGLRDFYGVLNNRKDVGNMADFEYDGNYSDGLQLKRKRR